MILCCRCSGKADVERACVGRAAELTRPEVVGQIHSAIPGRFGQSQSGCLFSVCVASWTVAGRSAVGQTGARLGSVRDLLDTDYEVVSEPLGGTDR